MILTTITASLILSSNVGAYQGGVLDVKYQARVEATHSKNLLNHSINYNREKFYDKGSG